ncbi:MAG: DUF2203 domain-containing protein [Calditrichaceae bacterium]|jgi:hypothetical protein
MYHYEKHFTLDEARGHLPKIRALMADIRKISLHLRDIGFDLYAGKYKPGFHPDTLKEFPDDYENIIEKIREVTGMGIEIKGLDYGLVDFPALRDNGEEVFLCWKIDEPDIEFWHSIDGGFKGRRHVDDF